MENHLGGEGAMVKIVNILANGFPFELDDDKDE